MLFLYARDNVPSGAFVLVPSPSTGVQLLMEQWKQALVALHAAGPGVICSRLGSVGSLCMR